MNHSSFTNIAFISYKREDEKWAKWLQKKLEHYQLPIDVRKQNPDMEFAKRPRHVFKDTTNLSGGVLGKAIKEGLASSKYLIVICSPLTARSPWVCKEVQEFIEGRAYLTIPLEKQRTEYRIVCERPLLDATLNNFPTTPSTAIKVQ